jgi:H+/Cl- antiporter ClcA
MGGLEWLKKDVKRDIKKIKQNPERFIGACGLGLFGGMLAKLGWDWLHLPSLPQGQYYRSDYPTLGFFSFIAGGVLIAICFLVLSTMKIKEEKSE